MTVGSYLLAVVLNIGDFPPGERDLGGELVVLLVDIQSECIHPHPQLSALLVLVRESMCILLQNLHIRTPVRK